MNKIKVRKRVLALISATTITLTMSGCNHSKNNSDTTTSIIFEIDNSNSTTSDINSSEENSNVQNNENNNKEDAPSTSSTIILGTTSRPSNNSKPSSSSTPGNSSSTSSSSKPATSQPSSPQATSKPTVQAAKKLTSSNINDISAIDAIATDAKKYVYSFNGDELYLYIGYSYNGKTYYCEKDEFRMFISLLNIEYFDKETLNEMFGEMSREDIIRLSKVFGAISTTICQKNVAINYDQFVVDNNIRLFLNELQTQVIKYKNQGNIDGYNKYVEDYFNGNNKYIKYGKNVILDNYVYTLCGRTTSLYDNVYLSYLIRSNSSCSSKYNNYIQNDFYNNTKAKQLVKE